MASNGLKSLGAMALGVAVGVGMMMPLNPLPPDPPLPQDSPATWIVAESLRVGLPPEFVLGQFYRESGLRPGAHSTATHGTANVGYAQLNLGSFPGAVDVGWKAQIRSGIGYLRGLYVRCYGDPVCTEWAYRSGKVRVGKK